MWVELGIEKVIFMGKINLVKAHPVVALVKAQVKAHPVVATAGGGGILAVIGLVYSIVTGVIDLGGFLITILGEDLPKIVVEYSEDGSLAKTQEIKDGWTLNSFAKDDGCSLRVTIKKNNDGWLSRIKPDIPQKCVYVFQVNSVDSDDHRLVSRLFPENGTNSCETEGLEIKIKCERKGPPENGKIYFLVYPEKKENFLYETDGSAQPSQEKLWEDIKGGHPILDLEANFTVDAPPPPPPPPPLQVKVEFKYLLLGDETSELLSDNSKLRNGDKIGVGFKSPQGEGYAQAFLKEDATGRCTLIGPISGSPFKMETGIERNFFKELEKLSQGQLTIIFRATREEPQTIPKESDGSVAKENCSTTPRSDGEFIKFKTFSYQP
ncbi:MAG: hypothetical protein BWK78_01825 [Thiotrichaceae bacterium IS1]|nr:MAG: hypothetical protein BWK78_01825 [Thiotrichaceae bacterium IS1]